MVSDGKPIADAVAGAVVGVDVGAVVDVTGATVPASGIELETSPPAVFAESLLRNTIASAAPRTATTIKPNRSTGPRGKVFFGRVAITVSGAAATGPTLRTTFGVIVSGAVAVMPRPIVSGSSANVGFASGSGLSARLVTTVSARRAPTTSSSPTTRTPERDNHRPPKDARQAASNCTASSPAPFGRSFGDLARVAIMTSEMALGTKGAIAASGSGVAVRCCRSCPVSDSTAGNGSRPATSSYSITPHE